jgi:hypothetical protein
MWPQVLIQEVHLVLCPWVCVVPRVVAHRQQLNNHGNLECWLFVGERNPDENVMRFRRTLGYIVKVRRNGATFLSVVFAFSSYKAVDMLRRKWKRTTFSFSSDVCLNYKSMPTRHAICWTYWYSALISKILTPKSYHRLGVIDIFSVCCGAFWNRWLFRVSDLFQKMRIQLPLKKNSPAKFVHAYAIRSTALYAVRHVLTTVPKVSERLRVRAHFIPKIAPPVSIGGHLDVSNISKISFWRRNTEKGHRKIAPRVGML